MQHLVVFDQTTPDHLDGFSDLEWIFLVISVGFLGAECEELYDAIDDKRISRYLADGWNAIDWTLHTVFLAYVALRVKSFNTFGGMDSEQQKESAVFAIRVLSLNCIFLWLRLMNVLTIN